MNAPIVKASPLPIRDLARFLLKNRLDLPLENWTMQGFGFLRLRIASHVRLHVWDSRLRQPGVSDIHDHTQWAFTSLVISGSLVNIRYTIGEAGEPFNQATLNCGIGGGMVDGSTKRVGLIAGQPELYLPGMTYRQEPDEVHRTMPADGTVTLVTQERRDVDTARVFWPVGGEWGDAIPRQATYEEVDAVGGFALSIFP
jgi:hypothetical protein